ncbi:hypothetical protein DFS34DRAFT_602761 [Phlyctochytrium arcticum]|nr:hypothetical protein DFS34DRAFT_602761 [Phlyctochytrium arcticum]
MSALEAARALGTPTTPTSSKSRKQPSAMNETPTPASRNGHTKQLALSDGEDDDEIDIDNGPSTIGSEKEVSKGSGRMELVLGSDNRVSIPRPSSSSSLSNLSKSSMSASTPTPSRKRKASIHSIESEHIDIDDDIDVGEDTPHRGGGKFRPDAGSKSLPTFHKRFKSESSMDLDASPTIPDSPKGSIITPQDYEPSSDSVIGSARPMRLAKSKRPSFAPVRSSEPRPMRKKGLYAILTKLIPLLKQKDPYGFFLDPVDLSYVTDYMNVITEPMDLGTMEQKVDRRIYRSVDEFKRDFELVVNNAKTYNAPDTVYYKTAHKMGTGGLRLIERETTNVEIEMDLDEMGVTRAVEQSSSSGTRGPDGKKKNKKLKNTEEIELKMAERCMPDGSHIWERGTTSPPYIAPMNRFLAQYMSCRRDCLMPIDYKTMTVDMEAFGPYQYRELPPVSANVHDALLTRTAYGDLRSRAYVKSLERFTRGLDGGVQKRVEDKVHELTRGGHTLAKRVLERAAQERLAKAAAVTTLSASIPNAPPSATAKSNIETPATDIPTTNGNHTEEKESVTTEWGTVAIPDLIKHVQALAGRIISAAELEWFRREGVDIVPLLSPASFGVRDPELDKQLASGNVLWLLTSNTAELEEWSRKQFARLSGQSQHAFEEETTLAEKIRRRLLQLVQKAPASEFAAAKLPPLEVLQGMLSRAPTLMMGGTAASGVKSTTSSIASSPAANTPNLVPGNPLPINVDLTRRP